MKIYQTSTFKKHIKKLHVQQKRELDLAVRLLIDTPTVGNLKKGDLADVRVYKFHMTNQLMLLAYHYSSESESITLLALGTHENFYRDLKGLK